MQGRIKYEFSGKVWQHKAPGGWFFVSLPKAVAKEIREHLQWQEEGWGRMKARVVLDNIEWDTAIWFDKKHNTYLLPLKADIRKKAHLKLDDTLAISIFI